MKSIKRIALGLLALVMLTALVSCSGGKPATTPVFSYEGREFSSGMFSFMLSSEKAYYESYFNYINQYYPDAKLGWNSPVPGDEGKTHAQAVQDTVILNAKRMVIIDHLCNKYNLKLTDEMLKTIDGYIKEDTDKAGGNKYELELEYSEYGVDIDMVRKYYEHTMQLSVLQEHLYGKNGIQRIPESEVKKKFDENYYKVESMYFSYYKDAGKQEWKKPEGITDDAVLKYFHENFVKAQHIIFKALDNKGQKLPESELKVKEAQAKELFDQITKGEITYEKALEKSEDPEGNKRYPEGYVFTHGELTKEFEDAAFEMKKDEIRLVKTELGWHIIKKNELNDKDMDGLTVGSNSQKIKDACTRGLTMQIIDKQAKDFYEDVKSGKEEFGADKVTPVRYEYDAGKTFKKGESNKALEDAVYKIKPGETSFISVPGYGAYIIRRAEPTEKDFTDKYAEVEGPIIQETYIKYVDSFLPNVVVNNDELKKYDIKTAKPMIIGK